MIQSRQGKDFVESLWLRLMILLHWLSIFLTLRRVAALQLFNLRFKFFLEDDVVHTLCIVSYEHYPIVHERIADGVFVNSEDVHALTLAPDQLEV